MGKGRPKWGGRQEDEHAEADRRRRATASKSIRRVKQRLFALSWWRGVMMLYPGGVVPAATAARILDCSRARIRELIAEGRIPTVEGMPGGNRNDLFVPLDALFALPTPSDVGRPAGWNMGQEYLRSVRVGVNPWCEAVGLSTIRRAQRNIPHKSEESSPVPNP